MDSMLKMTGNDFPVYNARVDIPCKSGEFVTYKSMYTYKFPLKFA